MTTEQGNPGKPALSLGGKTTIYLASAIASAGIPLLLMPILTRTLSTADYGVATMFALLVTVLTAIVGASAHAALNVKRVELGEREFGAYVRGCLVIVLGSAIVLLPAILLLGEPLGAVIGVPRIWLPVALAAATCWSALNVALAVYVSLGHAGTYGAVQVGFQALNLSASVALVVVVGLSWEGRALGIALAVLTMSVLAWLLVSRCVDLKSHQHVRVQVRSGLHFGLPLVPHSLGALLMLASDRFVVSTQLGNSAVGIYMVGVQIGLGLILLTESCNRAYAPWLMEHLKRSSPARDILLVRHTYLYFLALLLAAALLGLLGRPLVNLLAGDAYADAATLVPYVALGCAFTGCYYMVTNYVFFAGSTGRLATITISLGVLNLPLAWFAVKALGLEGGAISLAAIQFLKFLLTWLLAQRCHPMPWLKALRLSRSTAS